MPAIGFVANYVKVLDKLGETNMVGKMGKLHDISVNQTQTPWRRFACAKAIFDVRKKYKQGDANYTELTKMLSEIVNKETNEQLKAVYAQMMGV